MAYPVLVSLEKLIDQILNDDRYSISVKGKQHIISLDKYVICIRAFLEDFPEKSSKNLEARIRDVAKKAEDMIEWFMNQQIRHYVFRYVHWIAELRRIKFEYQLRKVSYEMDSIARDVVEIKNSIEIKDAQLNDSVGASSAVSQVADAAGKTKMVGLNEDLIEIKDRLCSYSRQLQILPITGMGGIGKTTLARNAYNDLLIFQIRVWITISQDYSEGRILSDLLNSMKEFLPKKNKELVAENSQGVNESLEENSQGVNESLEENSQQGKQSQAEESSIEKAVKVYQTLYGRRFLIVMDDIWSTKVLDDLKKLFPNDNNGSRILLTTRLGDVANSSTSSPSHEMRLMGANQSWNLLQQKVTEHQESCNIPSEVESIGKEIARSCGGLPLAVVVVAGLLSTVTQTQDSWAEIARKVKSSLATTVEDGQIEKILSLSYNHLPHNLRACFLYMGGFPEDHEIKAVNLMRFWIAEGFVKAVPSISLEESAEEYMEDLIKRNLVVVSKTKPDGRIKSCSLHDLVRDLCIKLSQEEKFLVHVKGTGRALKYERRISISRSDIDSLANISSSTIRSIMYFQDTLTGSFGSFRLLRVLHLLSIPFESRLIPDQFFELFHLRYLALWYDTDISIPRAISNLQSLQTLIIKRAYYIRVDLPCEIWNMPQLRHLIFLGHCSVSAYPTQAVESLQTLGTVMDLICSLRVVQMFPNLKKLSLTYSSSFTKELLFLHNLLHLRGLERLKLELNGRLRGSSGEVAELVLPRSLKKLSLIGWGRHEPYLRINNIGSLPNLQVLKLRRFDFETREWITGEEDCFPELRFLLIEESDLLQWNIQPDGGGRCFPVLERLLIHSCWSLGDIPESIGEIPTLKSIEVKGCKSSVAECVRVMQEEQQSYGDDVFQVGCINCEGSPQPPNSYKSYEREVERARVYRENARRDAEKRKGEVKKRRRGYKESRASGMHAVTHMLRNNRRLRTRQY